MILHYMDTPQEPYCPPQLPNPAPQLSQQQTQSHFFDPRGFNTAPAHIAFNSNTQSIPLPAEVDFDISPLTSPWLGANQQSMESRQTSNNKRTASASDEDSPENQDRKRISPAIRPTLPRKAVRGYKSMSSTPIVRSTRSRKGSTAGDAAGDTPSPVDLSMPPPAPPTSQVPDSGPSVGSLGSNPTTPNLPAHLMPVTPASIMNLGKFGMNRRLAPATDAKLDSKGKTAVRPKAVAESAARRSGKKSESPSLKAILPGIFVYSSSLLPSNIPLCSRKQPGPTLIGSSHPATSRASPENLTQSRRTKAAGLAQDDIR
jgi:hypothetical protein